MKNTILVKIGFGLLILAAIIVFGVCFSDFNATVLFSGCATATMAAIGNIEDVTDKETSGDNIAYKVYILDINQIDDTVPFPKPNAIRELGQIMLKAGQYMKYFVAHTIPTLAFNSEKGDITTTGKNTFTMVLGGVRDQILQFIEDYPGGKFIIFFKEIGSDEWMVVGSYDRPMVLQTTDGHNDKDGRYVTVTFERSSILQYNKYTGAIVTAPAKDHTPGDTTLAISPEQDMYNIPNGTDATYAIASVSGLTNTDKGRTITLVGTGTDKAATIADNSTFILEDGATWTAKAGSRISFRVMDPITLTEVLGSRVQTA